MVNITSADTIKDIGVIINSNLKFHAHVNSVICKANRTFGITHKIYK